MNQRASDNNAQLGVASINVVDQIRLYSKLSTKSVQEPSSAHTPESCVPGDGGTVLEFPNFATRLFSSVPNGTVWDII